MSQVGYELRISDVRITICSSQSQQSSEIKSFFLCCSRHCACLNLYISVLDPQVFKCGVVVIYVSFTKYRRSATMTNIFSVFSRSDTTVDLTRISYGPHLLRVPNRWHTCDADSRTVTDLNPTPRLG
jgi:hypothetical protein